MHDRPDPDAGLDQAIEESFPASDPRGHATIAPEAEEDEPPLLDPENAD